jgi:hypothetical protein
VLTIKILHALIQIYTKCRAHISYFTTIPRLGIRASDSDSRLLQAEFAVEALSGDVAGNPMAVGDVAGNPMAFSDVAGIATIVAGIFDFPFSLRHNWSCEQPRTTKRLQGPASSNLDLPAPTSIIRC